MHRAARFVRDGRYWRALGLGVGTSLILTRRPQLLDSAEDGTWTSAPQVNRSGSSGTSGWLRRAAARESGETRQQDEPEDSATSASQPPPPQTKGHSVFDIEGDADDSSAWRQATDRICAVGDMFTGWDFASFGERLASYVVPPWIQVLPGLVRKLQDELSMEPWSLSWEIWEEAHDPEINPEIIWDAHVRISKDLCVEEKDFLSKRRIHTARALANYLDVPEADVHPDDVPIIAMCGSGGGLRALVAGTSSFLSSHEAGLFDCVTYTAGVSGSCWLQALYYSSIGQLSHQRLIEHLKHRIGVHIAYPPAALTMLNQAPTNKYLLSGFVEKLKGVPDADFGLVDIYGLLLAARLMVPKAELRVSDYDLKISNQRYYIDDGRQPLPIYTAVRHEIPDPARDVSSLAEQARLNAKHYDWFEWFEWTPYEFFCEEFNAGIPTWAMGRRFEGGRNVMRENGLALPELRMPLLLGIFGSAFCATLSHYYREIRPIITAAGLGSLDAMLTKNDEDLVKVHPVNPAVIPNFLLGLKDRLPSDCPDSIHESTHLQLMDAGMSNNLPIYPLLRPGRDIDVIVAFDASADVKTDNWLHVVGGHARQRGIKGWPMGAGWPTEDSSTEEIAEDLDTAEAAASVHSAKTAEAIQKEGTRSAADLGPCTVWVGTTQEHREFMDDPPSYRLNPDFTDAQRLTADDAGLTLIYFPFLKNAQIEGIDPMKSDFMSTWNFVYTPPEIDQAVALARANFEAGSEQTKRTIRAVWQRKRARRLKAEHDEQALVNLLRSREFRPLAWRSGDVGQGDQFS